MFKIISLFFFFFSFLIDFQFVNTTLPHYNTKDFSPVTAIVSSSHINNWNTKNIYSVEVTYSYVLNNHQYNNNKIQTDSLLFNSKDDANDFLNQYSTGKTVLTYYDKNNPANSYLQKGLTNKDLNTLLILVPINITSLLVLYLGFILGWKFNQRNILTPLASGMLGSLIFSIPCSLILIFIYNLNATETSLILILFFNLIAFLFFMIFKKITGKTIHKYHRNNTKEYNLSIREGQDYTVQGFYKLKRDGFLPIIMIDSLLIMATIFNWAQNQFIFNNTMMLLIVLGFIITLIYLYSLTKKENYNNSFTA